MKFYARIKRFFDEEEKRRRKIEDASRKIVRICSRGMMRLHAGKNAAAFLKKARKILKTLEELDGDHPAIVHAQQEFAEFFILNAILSEERIPEPEEIGVPYYPYLMGLAEVGGELRRAMLDFLRKGDREKAEMMLEHMERIFEFLSGFDHPESVIPGLRRKKDVFRKILEQSRGDFIVVQQRIDVRCKKD